MLFLQKINFFINLVFHIFHPTFMERSNQGAPTLIFPTFFATEILTPLWRQTNSHRRLYAERSFVSTNVAETSVTVRTPRWFGGFLGNSWSRVGFPGIVWSPQKWNNDYTHGRWMAGSPTNHPWKRKEHDLNSEPKPPMIMFPCFQPFHLQGFFHAGDDASILGFGGLGVCAPIPSFRVPLMKHMSDGFVGEKLIILPPTLPPSFGTKTTVLSRRFAGSTWYFWFWFQFAFFFFCRYDIWDDKFSRLLQLWTLRFFFVKVGVSQ